MNLTNLQTNRYLAMFKSGQGMTRQDISVRQGQFRISQDMTAQDKTRLDRSGMERSGQPRLQRSKNNIKTIGV